MERNVTNMNLMEQLENDKTHLDRQVRGRFITELNKLINNFDESYSISQILHTLIQWKTGFDHENPYFWSDEKLLKKTEELYKKMVKEAQDEKYGK